MTEYGSDFSCVTDIDPRCVVVTGRALLSQAIARRLTTDRGRVIDDKNYGFNLAVMLNDDVTRTGLAAIRQQAEAECLKDERVLSARVTITPPASGVGTYTVTVALTDAAGPFDLTLSVSGVTVALLTGT